MTTLEQLAEKLNEKVWTKGELKRIYLNGEGFNTKKMSTKTFIYQDKDGSFKVSCYIDCPSQGWNWIKKQQEEVIESVEERIERALATEYYFAKNKKTEKYFDNVAGKDDERYRSFLFSDTFITRKSLEKAICDNGLSIEDYDVITVDRGEAEAEQIKAWEIHKSIKNQL